MINPYHTITNIISCSHTILHDIWVNPIKIRSKSHSTSIFLWISYGFPWFSWFPMDFLGFSNGFPRGFFVFSNEKSHVSPGETPTSGAAPRPRLEVPRLPQLGGMAPQTWHMVEENGWEYHGICMHVYIYICIYIYIYMYIHI